MALPGVEGKAPVIKMFARRYTLLKTRSHNVCVDPFHGLGVHTQVGPTAFLHCMKMAWPFCIAFLYKCSKDIFYMGSYCQKCNE